MEGIENAINRVSIEFCDTLKEFFVKLAKKCKDQTNIKEFLYKLLDYITGINILLEANQQQIIPRKFNQYFLVPYSQQINEKNEDFFLKENEETINYEEDEKTSKTEILDQICDIRNIYINSTEQTRNVVWHYLFELKRLGKMFLTMEKNRKRMMK